MKIFGLFISSIITLVSVSAQNNALVINDNAYVVLNGGTSGNEAVLVVNQSNPAGIITSGSGGNIITDGEFDYVKWNIQTGSGNYSVPFTTDNSNVKIPLSINVTSAGTGTGYLALSTWEVSTGVASNNMPYPSEVVHMAGANGQADVSEYVVDRFWIMDVNDPLGTGETFGTEPVATYSFGFNPSIDETGGSNALAVMNLGAQRYNGATDKWHGWFSGTPAVANAIWGTSNGTSVSGVAPVGPWYRTWTLADISEPLPVELTYFEANCDDKGVVLNWETASELNNDYFEVQKSEDGVAFDVLAIIQANGTSSSNTQYAYVDPTGTMSGAFYRISQVDLDGNSKEYEAVKVNPCFANDNLTVFAGMEGEVVIELETLKNEDYSVVIYDAIGKQIGSTVVISAEEGGNRFSIQNNDLAFGSYLVTLRSETKILSRKVVLK